MNAARRDEAEEKSVLDSLVLKKATRLFKSGSLKQDFRKTLTLQAPYSKNYQFYKGNPALKNHITSWNALKRIWQDQKHKTNLTHMGYSVV